MKKYKVTVYQMGVPAVLIIIETPKGVIYGERTIYFLNDNDTTLASFPIGITSVQQID